MSASTEPTNEVCLGCDQVDGVRWVTSTPETDVWACRHCGTEWTITVYAAVDGRG
jgi:ribosomal protein L37AE/L43A